VVDGSFMVTSAAVNPTLTIIANSLRVGDHLLERLGANAMGGAETGMYSTHPDAEAMMAG